MGREFGRSIRCLLRSAPKPCSIRCCQREAPPHQSAPGLSQLHSLRRAQPGGRPAHSSLGAPLLHDSTVVSLAPSCSRCLELSPLQPQPLLLLPIYFLPPDASELGAESRTNYHQYQWHLLRPKPSDMKLWPLVRHPFQETWGLPWKAAPR